MVVAGTALEGGMVVRLRSWRGGLCSWGHNPRRVQFCGKALHNTPMDRQTCVKTLPFHNLVCRREI